MLMTKQALSPCDQPTGQVRPKSLRTAPICIFVAGTQPDGAKPERVRVYTLASGLPGASVCGYLTAIRAPVKTLKWEMSVNDRVCINNYASCEKRNLLFIVSD